MADLNIKVLKWNDAAVKIKAANSKLFGLMEPIANLLSNRGRNYVYEMSFKFGESLIEGGQMFALKKNRNLEYINTSRINFNPKGFSGKQENDLTRFIEDCGQDTDHPLSLVTKNYIEVYCTHISPYKLNDSLGNTYHYSFPLNIIEKGQLFGVWGSVNSIFKYYKENYYGWNAVAGKKCIMPLFPEPQERKSSQLYRNKFHYIFSEETVTAIEGINHYVNEFLGEQKFAEILIIPEIFYTSGSQDAQKLEDAKYRLREYLFEIAWDQTKVVREMVWDDKELMTILDINESDFVFHLTKHIINISNSNSFLLKPVSLNDGVLFDVFKQLVEQFKEHSDRTGSLLEYTTPIFLHYTKLSKENPKGIEFTHSPSINMLLPGTRMDTMKDNIMYKIFFNHKVEKYLKERGCEISLKYYKEKPKINGKRVGSVDNTPRYVTDLKEYIENDLFELYSSILPANTKIRLPKAPALFNSFVQIERTNW